MSQNTLQYVVIDAIFKSKLSRLALVYSNTSFESTRESDAIDAARGVLWGGTTQVNHCSRRVKVMVDAYTPFRNHEGFLEKA